MTDHQNLNLSLSLPSELQASSSSISSWTFLLWCSTGYPKVEKKDSLSSSPSNIFPNLEKAPPYHLLPSQPTNWKGLMLSSTFHLIRHQSCQPSNISQLYPLLHLHYQISVQAPTISFSNLTSNSLHNAVRKPFLNYVEEEQFFFSVPILDSLAGALQSKLTKDRSTREKQKCINMCIMHTHGSVQ